MSELELLQRTGLAVAIGLLIGIERGWQERQAHDGARVAGIRTFTLIGALGALCGLLADKGATSLGLSFLGFALPFGYFEWRKAENAANYSATDLIAGLLTFAMGAYAERGNMAVAAAAGVTATAILAERRVMHSFLQHLKWIELRAALMLLIMTAVLLPALPDYAVDPWGALNPHQIWLMTVLTGAVCYAGYIAVRLAGERKGLLYAGIMGGLATSTTVTWMFARFVKANPASLSKVMTAILGAWVISLLRMSVLAVVIAPALIAPLAAPIAASVTILSLAALLSYRAAGNGQAHNLALRDPFELTLMLRFTLLLAIIMLLSKLFGAVPSHSGLFVLGGVSGLLDVDPITLSMASFARTGMAPATAAATILVAAASNSLAKSVLALVFGGPKLGLYLGGLAVVACAAGAIAYIR
jgi:uncharacterized membrane protein (DUF4010 family)